MLLHKRQLLIRKSEFFFVIFVFFLVVLSVFIQQANFSQESMFDIAATDLIVPYKIFVLWMLMNILKLTSINNDGINYYVILSFLMIPICFTVLLFLIPSLNDLFYLFYKQEKFPGIGRFGGIYGTDVNTLGMYSSLLFVYVLLLNVYGHISKFLVLLLMPSIFMCVLLSGMRTGLLVGLPLILYLTYLRYSLSKVVLNVILLLGVVLIFLNFLNFLNFINEDFYNTILDRFSIGNLMQSMGFGSSSGGNLNHASKWFNELLSHRTWSLSAVLFGFDVSINFVDNLYLYVFIKHGVFLLTLIIIMFMIYSIYNVKNNNVVSNILIIFTLIISIKGIFILNEYFLLFIYLINKACDDKLNRKFTSN
jgi:hypothetical protein